MEKLGWEGDQVEGMPPDIYNYEKIECYMQGVEIISNFLSEDTQE